MTLQGMTPNKEQRTKNKEQKQYKRTHNQRIRTRLKVGCGRYIPVLSSSGIKGKD